MLGDGAARGGAEKAIEQWSQRNGAALERCLSMLADIKASRTYDTTTLPVALREVAQPGARERRGRRVVHDDG